MQAGLLPQCLGRTGRWKCVHRLVPPPCPAFTHTTPSSPHLLSLTRHQRKCHLSPPLLLHHPYTFLPPCLSLVFTPFSFASSALAQLSPSLTSLFSLFEGGQYSFNFSSTLENLTLKAFFGHSYQVWFEYLKSDSQLTKHRWVSSCWLVLM